MNVPPGAPPPSPMAPPPQAPPPPPASGGGWVKWVLIGCGCILFAGLVATVGCWVVMRKVAAIAEQTAKAWTELGERQVKGNRHVEKYLGRVTRVTQTTQRGQQGSTPLLTYRVQGETDEGVVEIEIEVKDASDLMNPKVVASHLYFKGKKVDLETGKETEHKGPPPSRSDD